MSQASSNRGFVFDMRPILPPTKSRGYAEMLLPDFGSDDT
jgi:hypothetical protein